MTRKLTDQQKIDICEKYKTGNYTCVELGNKYGCSRENISRILKSRKIDICNNQSVLQKKYTINENYFDVIDTEDKAYFLGLMYADGTVSNTTNLVSIGLSENDKYILDIFNFMLGSNKPLSLYERSLKNKNWSNSYRLNICNYKIAAQLKKLGCQPNKTFILEFPTEDQVPQNLQRHFIRGYFDGDGCFYHSKNLKYYEISIVSTESFCLKLSFIMESLGWQSRLVIRHKERNNSTRTLKMHRKYEIYDFLKWIYKDSNYFIKRKYDKFKSVYSNEIEKEKIMAEYL